MTLKHGSTEAFLSAFYNISIAGAHRFDQLDQQVFINLKKMGQHKEVHSVLGYWSYYLVACYYALWSSNFSVGYAFAKA